MVESRLPSAARALPGGVANRTMSFVHATAIVDEGARVGSSSRIWHFVHVSSGAIIGEHCVLGQNVFVGRDVQIGDGCKVQNNVSIYAGVHIEREAFLGPSCVFTNVLNPRAFVERKDEFRPTHVGRGATIGANATIVCGHRIGPYATIGAGSVVTRDVPPHGLVYGNPARRHGWVCRCGEVLRAEGEVSCSRCSERYLVDETQCKREAEA